MSKSAIAPEALTHYMTNLKALGVIVKDAELAELFSKLDKSEPLTHPFVERTVHLIRSSILGTYKNAEWLEEHPSAVAECEVIFKELADLHLKMTYMGINISRVLLDLSDTPFASIPLALMEVIESFTINDSVIEAYREYSRFDTLTESDEDAQGIQGDLEFEYRCQLLDALKEGLGIPQEIVDDQFDTHTICYDAINEYDENLLIGKETQNMIEDMAAEKNDLDLDGFLDSVEMFKNHGYIEYIDGDVITWSRGLDASVAGLMYDNELERLESIS